MSFGIAIDIRSEVRVCTPDLLSKALDSTHVARICAEFLLLLSERERRSAGEGSYPLDAERPLVLV